VWKGKDRRSSRKEGAREETGVDIKRVRLKNPTLGREGEKSDKGMSGLVQAVLELLCCSDVVERKGYGKGGRGVVG
jgi:hypothetical protein